MKKKWLARIVAGVMLVCMMLPSLNSLAYQFGYTETGSAFQFTGSNYYYSMILPKINDDYVRINVTTYSPNYVIEYFIANIMGTNTNTANTGAKCGQLKIQRTGTSYVTNYVYENGYSLCYLKMFTNYSYGGVCLGTWDPNNG